MYPFLKWKDCWYKTSNKTYDIYKCNKCKLEKIYPMPSREEQSTFYPNNYYSFSLSQDKKVYKNRAYCLLDNILEKIQKKEFEVDYILKNLKIGNYLDIWCGDGVTIKKATLMGRNAYGFEFSNEIKISWLIHYWPSIKKTSLNQQKYDVIYMRHVFEHLDDPQGYLDFIYNHLADDGILVIILPNTKCMWSLVFGPYAPERDIPRHLYNYNADNILKFLSTSFIIIRNDFLSSYSYSIGFQWMLNDKFNIELKWWKKIFQIPMVCLDILFSIVWNTNQLWVICKKKYDNA